MQKWYMVEFNNYYGSGYVRELEFEKGDKRIKKDGKKSWLFEDEKLGLRRCLYKTKWDAEYVLMMLEQD